MAPDRHVLFHVTAVVPGDLAELDDATRTMLLEQFARARGLVEYDGYVRSLRANYTISIGEDRL